MLKLLVTDIKLFSILLIAAIFLTALDNQKYLDLFKSPLQQLTIPIQYGLYKSGQSVYNQFEFIALSRRASQENKALTEQIATILSENANLRRKLAETEGFLQQQKSLNPQTFTLVAARPVGISRYLRIDQGSESGIKLNQAVVYKDNYLGIVKNVTPKQAEVLLSTDPDSKLSAFVSSKDGKAKGVLSGQYGSEMLLDKILHQEPVQKGDLVYSEGTEIDLPRGLIIGHVSEVLERENEVFKQAKVKPIFDITNLDILFVITN